MIKVLRNWADIGEAIGFLTEAGKDKNTRVFHATPIKNWDLAQIARILLTKPKDIKILDMGCGGSNTLRLCYRYGFNDIYGVDLQISFQDRWQQLMLYKSNNFRLPYHLSEYSITRTRFPDRFFDLLICLSVIEHGVNAEDFFNESGRIIKPGGLLYISTDYWPKKIDTRDAPLNYGTDPDEWNIFSDKEIKKLILAAQKHGFILKKDSLISRVNKPVVSWNNMRYTFISIQFTYSK